MEQGCELKKRGRPPDCELPDERTKRVAFGGSLLFCKPSYSLAGNLQLPHLLTHRTVQLDSLHNLGLFQAAVKATA
jgi:hypothetical protein